MRITKISVKGLFGIFDHEIPLNQDSRITIVHGPNGVGKTVLMRMVHGLFHFEYDVLGMAPFEQLRIDFHKGDVVIVYGKKYSGIQSITYDDQSGMKFESFEPDLSAGFRVKEAVKKAYPDLERIEWAGKSYWLLIDKSRVKEDAFNRRRGVHIGEAHTLTDLIEWAPVIHNDVYGDTPEWFWNMQKEIDTELIDTYRLWSAVLSGDVSGEVPSYRHSRVSLQGDDDFFESVSIPFASPSISDFHGKFESLFGTHLFDIIDGLHKRRKLLELAEDSDAEVVEILLSASKEIENQVQDREYYQEILLFMEIVNERLLFKSFRLDINEEDEEAFFGFYPDGGGFEIEFTKLSSGEQHLFVLYYHLLFEIQPDTLVMIDEPELSMNVVWQRNFLKDLQRIIELRKFDVLIATHSPQIIHDKWDWMVPLSEKLDD